MFCKKCGHEIDVDDLFCEVCGNKIVQKQNNNTQNLIAPLSKKTNMSNNIEVESNFNYQDKKTANTENIANPITPLLQQVPEIELDKISSTQNNDLKQESYNKEQKNYSYSQMPNNDYQHNSLKHQFPMKWYKFLIYFLLWAYAISAFKDSILLITGANNWEYNTILYKAFPALQAIDIVTGISALFIGIFCIKVRYALKKLAKTAINSLIILFLSYFAINVISLIAYCIALSDVEIDQTEIIIAFFIQLAFCTFMIAVNYFYFKKRERLFVN